MPLTITVTGVSSVKQTLANLNKAVQAMSSEDIPFIADRLRDNMKREAPRWSGHLRNQIFSINEGRGKARVETRTFVSHEGLRGTSSNKSYAAFVETGQKTKAPWPQRRSSQYKGFLSRALALTTTDMDRILSKRMDRAVR